MERDLCDIVREFEEDGGDVRWEVDTCIVCGHTFLVEGVDSILGDLSLCSWKCFEESEEI